MTEPTAAAAAAAAAAPAAKRRLLDAAVALLFAAGLLATARHVPLPFRGPHPSVAADELGFCEVGSYCDEGFDLDEFQFDVAAEPTPAGRSLEEPPAFEIGATVEVFDPNISEYAFVGNVIRTKTTDRGFLVYDVAFASGGVVYEDVAPERLSKAGPFAKGERAMCIEDPKLRAAQQTLVECRIVARLGTSAPNYLVLYNDDANVRRVLPLARIRRVVNKDDAEAPVDPDELLARANAASAFPVGSVVELYAPQSEEAFPATVTHRSLGDRYRATHGLTGSDISNIDPDYMHPYKVYEDGTPASCNVGEAKKKKVVLVPCTILGHIEDKRDGILGVGDVVYRVRAETGNPEDDEGVELFLPRMRVMRRLPDDHE